MAGLVVGRWILFWEVRALAATVLGNLWFRVLPPAIAKFQTNCYWLDSDNFINDRCAAQTSRVFALSQIGCNDCNDNSVGMFEVWLRQHIWPYWAGRLPGRFLLVAWLRRPYSIIIAMALACHMLGCFLTRLLAILDSWTWFMKWIESWLIWGCMVAWEHWVLRFGPCRRGFCLCRVGQWASWVLFHCASLFVFRCSSLWFLWQIWRWWWRALAAKPLLRSWIGEGRELMLCGWRGVSQRAWIPDSKCMILHSEPVRACFVDVG